MKNNFIKLGIFVLLLLAAVICCRSSDREETNQYFYNFEKEMMIRGDKGSEQVREAEIRELEKYKKTGEKKYLLSSKFAKMFYYKHELEKDQLQLVYELIKLNDEEYDYITIICNQNIAFQFEHNSPKLSMQFLNDAIRIDEKDGKRYMLPHLYHLKGRLYYNQRKYTEAIAYFQKSLKVTGNQPEDQVYISSMHNNIGMCYDKMGNLGLAINEGNMAIRILEAKKNLTEKELAFMSLIKGTTGYYYYKQKDYTTAENLLLYEYTYYKDKPELFPQTITNTERLFQLYSETQQPGKMKEIVDYVFTLEKKAKKTTDQILINEIAQSYYLKINDAESVKALCKKLMQLHEKSEEESVQNLANAFDLLNNYIVKNINQKYQHKLEDHRLKNQILLGSVLFVLLIFGAVVYTIKKINRKEKMLAQKEKIILEKTKKILEQNIWLQEDKITSLHLNLNLKMETEKAFLEHVKKVKRAKNIDIEQTLTDLFFQVNNLIQIDKKNFDVISESSLENRQFAEKLSSKFPALTKQEIKLCVYYKLELTSKEISLLENVTEGSARVYKTKIKAKMNLGKDVDLNEFLKGI